MSELNRRHFFSALAAAIIAGVGVARSTVDTGFRTLAEAPASTPTETPPKTAHPPTQPALPGGALLPPPPPAARVALPGGGVLNRLPAEGDLLALTVDDGASTEVLRLYTEFARDTGFRLTYFITGNYRSWTDNAPLMRPLVDSGQIQLANHTWSHPDLTMVPKTRVAEEISRNHNFIRNTFGVDARPYYRPPYGHYNSTVEAVAADLGYTATTMWSGSFADSTEITEAYIADMATKFFTPGTIVLGHLNYMPVTNVYPHLVALVRERGLRTVTLDDVFVTPS